MIGVIISTVILTFLFTYYALTVNRYYIRIGEIPENELSKIHRGKEQFF